MQARAPLSRSLRWFRVLPQPIAPRARGSLSRPGRQCASAWSRLT